MNVSAHKFSASVEKSFWRAFKAWFNQNSFDIEGGVRGGKLVIQVFNAGAVDIAILEKYMSEQGVTLNAEK